MLPNLFSISAERQRIDIDEKRDTPAPVRLSQLSHRLTHYRPGPLPVIGRHQQMPPAPASKGRQSRRTPQFPARKVWTQTLGQVLRSQLGPVRLLAHRDHANKVGEWRIPKTLPDAQFSAVEAFLVSLKRHSNTGHIWIPCLHQHSPRTVRPPGSAGHLRQKLESPLRRSEVGHIERRIGVGHYDKGHMRKIVPLSDHLRAH
jgi:hypothetical protein